MLHADISAVFSHLYLVLKRKQQTSSLGSWAEPVGKAAIADSSYYI